MKTRLFPLFVATLLVVFTLPIGSFAQSTDVKPPNKNQSAKFKSAIFKGSGNLIQSNSIASFIGGGQSNEITLGVANGVIGGGFGNVVSNRFGTVSGGIANAADGDGATVSGGEDNVASGDCSAVAGGNSNTASATNSTVGGGEGNSVTVFGLGGVVDGGTNNKVSNSEATVGGGINNTASGQASVVGGGQTNTASDFLATVAGGFKNTASGAGATVGGGGNNLASGQKATVGGGELNAASGAFSTVPGGSGGRATNNGSFVWSGDTNEVTFSFGDDTFTARCEGGARFYTANGTNQGPRLAAGGADWIANSDSNLKTKVTAVNPRDILAKLSRLPVTEWEYKNNPNRRYIGPMAQDFHAVFGLGDDDKGIGTLDSDGVMYAAIKGLVEELKERDKAMAARDKTIEELKLKSAELDSLRTEFHRLREHLEKTLPPAP